MDLINNIENTTVNTAENTIENILNNGDTNSIVSEAIYDAVVKFEDILNSNTNDGIYGTHVTYETANESETDTLQIDDNNSISPSQAPSTTSSTTPSFTQFDSPVKSQESPLSKFYNKYTRSISKSNILETIPETIPEATENVNGADKHIPDNNKIEANNKNTEKNKNKDKNKDKNTFTFTNRIGKYISHNNTSVKNIKTKAPITETYVIFLPEYFFVYLWYSHGYYSKIIKNLRNKGIKVINILKMVKYQELVKDSPLLFDDNKYPDPNILYIHLFNGLYYNDAVFNKRKIEKERDMLLLLAGKLGVSSIRFNTQITETTLVNIGASASVKGLENSAKYTKNIKSYSGNSGIEKYANSGSAIYITSADLNEFDDNIKNTLSTLKSNIFNYDYYKKNSKLELFVYKRFEYKMSSLEYTIEVDDISDKSFAIKSCFMDYGIGMNIDKSTSYTEKISYTFNFYNDKEIRIQYYENMKRKNDKFLNIREIYDFYDNKDIAVHFICDYVKKLARDTVYADLATGECNNYYSRLMETIRMNPAEFYGICHQFTNTEQIREWLIAVLHNTETDRIIENPIGKGKFDKSIVFR